MSSPRKFVVPTLLVALWVATFGFVPRSAQANTTAPRATLTCVHLDATPSHQASFAAQSACGQQPKSDGIDVDEDEDGSDVSCCELAGHLPVAAASPSIGEHRDSAYVRPHWVSLSARGPPQS